MKFIAGMVVGAVVFWLYQNREALGFAVAHRNQLSAAQNLVDDFKALAGGTSS